MNKKRQPALKYYSAVTRALSEEMRRDKNVILIGEDVGPSGGIFAQTKGLHAEFGPLPKAIPFDLSCAVGRGDAL